MGFGNVALYRYFTDRPATGATLSPRTALTLRSTTRSAGVATTGDKRTGSKS